MASQYGIDMKNVLNTKDQIAMNKLKREKMERESAAESAGVDNRLREIMVENPGIDEGAARDMALDKEGYTHDRDRKEKKEDRETKHENALALQDHSLKNSKKLADYKEGIKNEHMKKETDRRYKIIKAQNPQMSDETARAYAGEQVKDISKVIDVINDAKTTGQVDAVIKMIDKDGATLHTIGSMEDPAKQAEAWTEYRNNKLKSIKDPKLLKQAMEKLPEKFDPNWTTQTIASNAELLKSASTMKKYLKQTEAEMRAKEGEGIGTATYAQQTAKVNAISKKVDGFTEDLGDPKLAAQLKAKVVKLWKEGGRKQNDDEIILKVIEEWEQNEAADASDEEKGFIDSLKEKVGFGDKKESKNALNKKPKKEKKGKALGKATKPEGTTGTYKGKKIKVVNGQWQYI